MKRGTLLIADDEEINRAALRAQFEHEYDFIEAENGEQAMMFIRQYHASLAAVLLDLFMPIKDGYEVMSEMVQGGFITRIPVIVITADDLPENVVRAFDLGASDIVIKPFEPSIVRRRVQNAVELNRHKLHLEEMLEEQAAKLRDSRDVIMDTLSSVIEHRSAETGQHVLRIRMFTKILLEEILRCCPEYNLDERAIGIISEAAALHDIGKIAIPDTILNKPGKLTAKEFEIMKTHAVKGCEILEGLDRMGDPEYLTYAYNICRYHHERWDGKGYPDGLTGDNTPIYAQAVGLADCFDALTTDRVYHKALPAQKVTTMILNGECGAFSPQLLECFKSVGQQFTELARSYADDQPLKRTSELNPQPYAAMERILATVPESGHDKYLSLLRYIDSTIMEVDLNLGVHHLVYQQNEDFQELRSSEDFEAAFRVFVEHCVHPDDRAIVSESLNSYISELFVHGLMKRTRAYRVLHRATGKYIRYEATALRVNIDNPKDHKLLIIWRQSEADPEAAVIRTLQVDAPAIKSLPVGVQQCLNDQWFTITYINEGFAALFGYSEQDIRRLFNNRFLEMIHPEDQQRVRRQFLEQFRVSGEQELEYRIVTKEGQTVWILDKGCVVTGEDGREYINCVLTDITQVKRAQDALRLSMERYQIILNQTNDIIFEWDILQDQITYSPVWEKFFGYEPLSSGEQVRTVSHILPEDMPQFLKLMQDMSAGTPYGEAEVRIANAQGKYLWCRIRATVQLDAAGKPIKAVGVIADIDEEKRQTQDLTNKAERDALTQLYNKATANEKIQQLLEDKSNRYALFLVDMDNFKRINDTRGHLFGDAVLTEISRRIKSLFRSGDIISRFGGDEFLIFMQHTSDEGILRKKAESLLDTFRSAYKEELQSCPLTCSIGVTRCPEDGDDFQTLFQQCDQALYHAKQRGKNCFAFYNSAAMKKFFGLDNGQFTAGTRIESDDIIDLSIDSLVPQTFRLLYESQDIEVAVNAILKMAGQKYNVSRVYIFEDSKDGLWTKNTFEWCNEGVEPEMASLQHVDYTELGEAYQGNFNENGIFYCQDVSKLPPKQYELLASQGIRSVLQCAVRDNGRFAGFVGFDDCALPRIWTQDQIDALTFISELLATFLLKKRAQDRIAASAKDMRMILDNQNSWIYVIDPDTYVLHYINAKTLRTVPDAREGMRCYRAFFHRNAPCEQCPANGIRGAVNQTLEIYNPVLNVWSIADASMIRWGEQDACLLACHDISDYKMTEVRV